MEEHRLVGRGLY